VIRAGQVGKEKKSRFKKKTPNPGSTMFGKNERKEKTQKRQLREKLTILGILKSESQLKDTLKRKRKERGHQWSQEGKKVIQVDSAC